MGGVQCCKEHIFRQDAAFSDEIEQGRFPGVGIADQGDDSLRRALPRFTLQPACAAHIIKLPLQARHLIVQDPAVTLNLRFARTGQAAGAAALALQMGPGPDKPRTLIAQAGELNLQGPLFGGRA